MTGIYDIEKMKQKPVYPTRETAQYSDWALFNMGKELEDYVDTLTPGGEEYTAGDGIDISEEHVISNTKPGIDYTAGTGIEITNENVINNTAPGVQYVAGDGIDISGDTISSLVKSLEFVSYNDLIIPSLTPGYGGHITVQNLDDNYDYFIFVEVDDGSHCIAPSFVTRGGTSIDLYVYNKGGGDSSGLKIGQYTIYRVKKTANWNYIHIIGSTAVNANMVPMGGDTGEVLSKISGTNYSVIWKTIGKTVTTKVYDETLTNPITKNDLITIMDGHNVGDQLIFSHTVATIGGNTYWLYGNMTKADKDIYTGSLYCRTPQGTTLSISTYTRMVFNTNTNVLEVFLPDSATAYVIESFTFEGVGKIYDITIS